MRSEIKDVKKNVSCFSGLDLFYGWSQEHSQEGLGNSTPKNSESVFSMRFRAYKGRGFADITDSNIGWSVWWLKRRSKRQKGYFCECHQKMTEKPTQRGVNNNLKLRDANFHTKGAQNCSRRQLPLPQNLNGFNFFIFLQSWP